MLRSRTHGILPLACILLHGVVFKYRDNFTFPITEGEVRTHKIHKFQFRYLIHILTKLLIV